MVEKEESVPSGPGDGAGTEPASVMNVDAVAELANPPSKPTLGDAIALLEAKLAALGIVLQVPEVKSGSLKQMKVSGKLQSLPLLIHFAITFALDTTDHVTKDSVGKASEDWKKSLVPGNIVALHGTTSNTGFLRIENESVIGSARQYHGGHQQQHQALNHLKLENAAERFLVVDAGNGNIALYSPTNRRFLASKDGALVACGFPITGLDERPRANEMFQPSTPPPSAPQAQLLNASPSPFGGISSPSAFGGAAPAAAPGGFNFGMSRSGGGCFDGSPTGSGYGSTASVGFASGFGTSTANSSSTAPQQCLSSPGVVKLSCPIEGNNNMTPGHSFHVVQVFGFD